MITLLAGAKPDAACPRGGPAASAARLPTSRWAVLSLAAILLGGLALRSFSLADRSVWFDEAFCWGAARLPFVDLGCVIRGDNTPPLYMLLLKGWMSLFGDSPVALRSLSVLFGELTILGMYLFVREAFGACFRGESGPQVARRAERAAVLTAALVALSALHVRYSWEARMYALGTALTAFCSWALFRALRAPAGARWWATYGTLALLFLYTHYFALFTVAAQAVFVLGFLLVRARWDLAVVVRDPSFRRGLWTAALITLGWVPWVSVFLRQCSQVHASFWIPPLTPERVGSTCYQMFVFPEVSPAVPAGTALLVGDFCLLGLVLLWRRAQAGEWYVLSGAVVPFALAVLVSVVGTPIFLTRYFLFAHLFLLTGLAVLVARITPFSVWALAASLVTATCLAATGDAWRRTDLAHHPGYRGAAEFINRQRRPGEAVVVCSPLIYPSILYHARPRHDVFLHADREVKHYEGSPLFHADDYWTTGRLERLRGGRVWVVNMLGGYWGDQAVPVPRTWVEKDRQEFPEVFEQGTIVVVAYETPGTARR